MAVLVALSLAQGCGRKRAAPEPSAVAPLSDVDRKAAEETAQRYLGALQAKDCASLPSLVKGPLSAEECQHDVKAFAEHDAELVRVVGAKLDGRDPSAILVTVLLRFGATRREEVFRVERDGSQWKVHR